MSGGTGTHQNVGNEATSDGATAGVENSSIAGAVITGIAVAALAPELLPGMAIGVAAMLAPKLLPGLGNALRPIVKTAVSATYAATLKAREMAAEAGEQFQDIVAEARAEHGD